MDLRQLVETVNSATGFIRSAAVDVVSVDKGSVTLRMPRQPDLLQFNGFFHGGAISGLADHAAGAAATTALPAGRIAVTVDLHVNFLKAANGGSITAHAKTVSVGNRLVVVAVEVTTEVDGASIPCAIATATLSSVEMPAN